jgi:dienelactone hydrolase
VSAPSLLIVGGADSEVIALNRSALRRLSARAHEMRIVPGATHLFEEPGALATVAQLASAWFRRHLG